MNKELEGFKSYIDEVIDIYNIKISSCNNSLKSSKYKSRSIKASLKKYNTKLEFLNKIKSNIINKDDALDKDSEYVLLLKTIFIYVVINKAKSINKLEYILSNPDTNTSIIDTATYLFKYFITNSIDNKKNVILLRNFDDNGNIIPNKFYSYEKFITDSCRKNKLTNELDSYRKLFITNKMLDYVIEECTKLYNKEDNNIKVDIETKNIVIYPHNKFFIDEINDILKHSVSSREELINSININELINTNNLEEFRYNNRSLVIDGNIKLYKYINNKSIICVFKLNTNINNINKLKDKYGYNINNILLVIAFTNIDVESNDEFNIRLDRNSNTFIKEIKEYNKLFKEEFTDETFIKACNIIDNN